MENSASEQKKKNDISNEKNILKSPEISSTLVNIVDREVGLRENILKPPPPQQLQVTTKTILFYTRIFGGDWNFFENRINLTSCPVQTCTFLQQSHNPENADALIFHQADYDPGKVPALRRQNQIYIWLTMEAPSIPKVVRKLSRLQRKLIDKIYGYDDFFNWTATYHHKSEVFIPYGRLESLNGETYTHTGDMYQSYLADVDQTDLPNTWTTHHNRTKMAAWMVSHCGTDSGRELYVKELRQYIDVDIYGKCGKLVCGKNHNEFCYTDVLAPTYKFYLAFENNVCQDYLIEKVWLPLKHGLVPVVYGGANYSIFLPPHSYIDATHLTPNQLAKLLISHYAVDLSILDFFPHVSLYDDLTTELH
ncbi:hypothetical protein Pcinc_000942 [Petrolisthes cinctipes]|uniref:Fucosyltransferase n=1 Tax=Petrolisthes cinctipes TaxID=88211 RepID=A0AAE1GNS2_PETCI|nr:hypothetical protein Pcinc_000942 [Petrolisthes cinctipes]